MSDFNANEFRHALGSFATGVTVITSIDEVDNPVGVTASSFNSVSLDPPLVLWSLAKNAMSLPAFQTSGHFCVHVLTAAQQDLSNKFASRGGDKFEGVDWSRGIVGLPLLEKYAARFQCKTTYQYEGGDHIIFVGEVVDYHRNDDAPLVFHSGRYALAKSQDSKELAGAAVDVKGGTFSSQFFLYLLSRAHYQSTYPLDADLNKAGLDRADYLALTLFGLGGPLSLQELHERIEHTGHAAGSEMMQRLEGKSLISETSDGTKYALTVSGRRLHIELLAKSKAIEEQLLGDFSPAEVADMRDFLTRFIAKSDPGIPDLWGSN